MAAVSKEEYLKRYLSGESDETTKKKRKKKVKTSEKRSGMMIVDDDIHIHSFAPKIEDIEEAPFLDEAPQVAGTIDERPEDVIILEKYRSDGMWKVMGKHDKADNDSGGAALRHDSSDDESPPRRGQVRQRHDSDSDISPLRRSRHDSDASPPRSRHTSRKKRHDSDSDLSPPRAKSSQRHDSDSDLSPPRTKHSRGRTEDSSDLSPPRRTRHDSDSDLSPLRKSNKSNLDRRKSSKRRYDSDSDQSPPRKHSSKSSSKPNKTLSGSKAGLSNAATLRLENEERRERDKHMFDNLATNVSGRDAETVFRDKGGRRRNMKAEKIQHREDEAKKAEEAEKYMQWGRGVVQSKEMEVAVEDHMYEMSKPLARYKDDDDLDEMLKQKDRDEDPMLAFIKKKRAKQAEKAGIKERPRYKGSQPPPNRFNIWPGYRWDGVDRSNGLEKKWFQSRSDKKAMDEISYKWSVEEM